MLPRRVADRAAQRMIGRSKYRQLAAASPNVIARPMITAGQPVPGGNALGGDVKIICDARPRIPTWKM
jgi:hypothetical protein